MLTGVDKIVSVMAGSVIWLDCSDLGRENDNLIQIGWRKNYTKFYNQYPLLHNNPIPRPSGRLANTSLGQEMGRRVKEGMLGQISIVPALPSDQGFYLCESARMKDNSGSTTYNRKSFIVVVGKFVTYVLDVYTIINIYTCYCNM